MLLFYFLFQFLIICYWSIQTYFNSFFKVTNYLVFSRFLGQFYTQKIMFTVNIDHFILFSICLSFVYFFLSTYTGRTGENGCLALFLILGDGVGSETIYHESVMLTVDFIYILFIRLWKFSFVPSLLSFFFPSNIEFGQGLVFVFFFHILR